MIKREKLIHDIRKNRILLIITSGMMELTWLYALACLLFLLLNSSLFPIWSATLAFFVPIIITSTLKGRGKRLFEHFIIHSLSYISLLLLTIYNYGYRDGSFLSLRWLEMFFQKQYGPVDGFAYILLIFWFSYFWYSGYKLIERPNEYLTITSRFDLGIAMLALTFIITGVTNTIFPYSSVLISYYFLFSILAIIISQNLKSLSFKNMQQLNNGRSDRMAFSFVPVLLLLASWIILFFIPQMTSAAQVGYHVLKIVSKPIGYLLLKILCWMFGFQPRPAIIDSTDSVGMPMPSPESGELSWFGNILEWIFIWGGILLFSLLAILAIGSLLYSLWKWFSLRTDLDLEKRGLLEELGLWLKHILGEISKFITKVLATLIIFQNKSTNITTLFTKLCRWGRNSGIPKQKFQTPLEYGHQLTFFFSNNAGDISLIIDNFNRERYGQKPTEPQELAETKQAMKRLTSPLKWPSRLLVRLFYAKKLSLAGVVPFHSQSKN